MTQSVNEDDKVIMNCSTLVELLSYRSTEQSEADAFTFLADGETQSTTLTYQELERQSRAIASQLQALGLTAQRALLLYPPGLDYLTGFFGCLYGGVVAVPAYPPRNRRNTPRILSILQDAEAAIILTTSQALPQIQSLLQDKINISNLRWLTTDNLTPGIENNWQQPEINSDTLAFLQYTSGSTGTPKGVMLTHGNLLHNATVTHAYMEHSASSKFVTWLPVYHDMGLIGGILQPLYGGFPCIMLPPAAFLQRPYRWLEVISRYGGTTSGAPNFAYDLCIDKITPEQRSTLDLSSWDVAFNGAEPIRQETLERFCQTFAECGFRPQAFYPCYGMAEATLMVSGSVKSTIPTTLAVGKKELEQNQIVVNPNGQEITNLVSCGLSIPQQQIVIAHPDSCTSCVDGEVGEVWVSSPSVGRGYWHRQQETEETFCAYLQDKNQGPFLRTGDLGFLHNGELFITGRAKDLIIIRGRNLYPQDIERTAESCHPSLRLGGVAAFAVEVENEEQLVVVQELEFRAKPNLEEVITAIRQVIAQEFEVQVYAVVLIKPGSILKTSSGKIQRRATKAGFLAGTLNVVGSSILELNPSIEKEVVLTRKELLEVESGQRQYLLNSYLQKLLGCILGVTAAELNFQQPLTSFGIDSLRVFELKNRIDADLEVNIPVANLFAGTIHDLGVKILGQVEGNVNKVYVPLPQVEKTTNNHPLSLTQQQLWFINQLQPGTPVYNIPIAIHIPGTVNVPLLIRSLDEIICRQEILRTSLEIVNGEPRQKVADNIKLNVPEVDLRHLSGEEQAREVERLFLQTAQFAFDFSQPPLLQAKLLHLQQKSILIITLHHLIADGWSIQVLVKELTTIYQAFIQGKSSPLPELSVQYANFVYWQQNWLQSQALEHNLTYWKQQLGGNLPVLQLPPDYPRPAIQSFRGGQQKFSLSKSLTKAIKRLSKQEEATLFMTLLATFQTLLYRYTGQEDILVGSPIANRNHQELDGLIGCFVNTLVLRTHLDGNPTFQELLARVRKVAIEAYTHQDLPFEKLVEALQPNRVLSHNPLFQVMFVLQNPKAESIWKTEELETKTAKFDLLLSMTDSEEGLTGTLEYNTDLFNPDTITRMIGHFQTLLESIVVNYHQHIANLSLLTPAEQQTILRDWNNTQVEYQQTACIHQLFTIQTEKTPDATALIFGDEKLTYSELNHRANQLAQYLQDLGVTPETIVGICMERSVEMVVGILGIMKAGGAYLPLDPSYPQQRLAYMLADAKVPILLAQSHLVDNLPPHQAQVINIDNNSASFRNYNHTNPVSNVELENIAYVIYTSGSTGKPKGVQIVHRSVVNFLTAMQRKLQLTNTDKLLSVTTLSFDIAVLEIFLPLITGAKLILVSREVATDGGQLLKQLNHSATTIMQATPATWRMLLDTGWEGNAQLKILCGGEALSQNLAGELCQRSSQVWNLYGPTETTIWSTIAQINDSQKIVSIGRPIDNTQIYILDKSLKPVPVGVSGELYIGGTGLARGYLNQPELTAEKFIKNPLNSEKLIYKTGDLARYLPNGEIEYLGRIDHQVKIRGFRIELGEIEAILRQHPQVRETVVVTREDIPKNHRLVAYIVPHTGNTLPVQELRDYLQQKLPDYMLPSVFLKLNKLPLTPNGKIDRRALPVPENQPLNLTATYEAPNSELETAIAKIWQEVLHLEKAGVNDNFFDLGGNSLLMVQVNNKLREVMDCDISVVEMFQNPTIKSLAKYINPNSKVKSAFTSINNRIKKQREAVNRQKSLIKRGRRLNN